MELEKKKSGLAWEGLNPGELFVSYPKYWGRWFAYVVQSNVDGTDVESWSTGFSSQVSTAPTDRPGTRAFSDHGPHQHTFLGKIG